jgi:hypothetical protein
VRTRLCKVVVCLALSLGGFMGIPMRADEIQELMRTMNESVIETTLPDESDKDDPGELRNR